MLQGEVKIIEAIVVGKAVIQAVYGIGVVSWHGCLVKLCEHSVSGGYYYGEL